VIGLADLKLSFQAIPTQIRRISPNPIHLKLLFVGMSSPFDIYHGSVKASSIPFPLHSGDTADIKKAFFFSIGDISKKNQSDFYQSGKENLNSRNSNQFQRSNLFSTRNTVA
jgi:hypothetical protein